MEITLLLGLIVLNGVFAMSEIALVTARKPRLQKLADDGDRAAVSALQLGDEPTRFLSTVQIGITAIGILNGIIGEAVLAAPLALWLQELGAPPQGSEVGATALVVLTITYLSIVVGELVPKRLAQISPEAIARRVARPMLVLAAVTRPFVRLLSVSTDLLLGLLGALGKTRATVTEEEIHAILAEGSDAGVIERQEHAMLRNVFRLDDRQVGSLMIPRADIVYLDVEDPPEVNLRKIETAEHSRFPVCRGALEEVYGFVVARQVLARMLRGEKPDPTADPEPAMFIAETATGLDLLEQFRARNAPIALVIDDYGDAQGLVTLRDVLEAIAGEFAPPAGEGSWAVRREDGSWLLDGLIPIPELKDSLGLRAVPEEEEGDYHSLAGMLLLLMGRIPRTGEHSEWEGWRFEVVDMDGKRIDKVLATRLPPLPDDSETGTDND